MLILRTTRTAQPQQPIAPDRAFDVLLLPPAGVGDQATKAWPTIGAGGTFDRRPSLGGQSFYFSGGSAQVSLPRLIYTSDRLTSLFGARSQTLVIQTRCISTPFGAVLSCGRPSANNMRFYLSLRNGSGNVEFLTHNGGFQAVSWSGSGISIGEFSTFVLVYNTDGTNGTIRLLKNGRDFGTQNFAASNFPSAAGEVFNFGAANASGLSDNFWGLEAEHTLCAILPGAMSPQEAAQVSLNPWRLFAPEPRRIWVPGAAPSGLTVNAGIGAATAAGSQATISLGRTVLTGIGAATATGLTASISLGRTVAAGIGAASANGLQAGISLGRTVGAGVGAATADGLQATIETGSGTIIAGVGAATATGLTAGISLGRTIGAGVGAAEARGLQATISTQIIVPTPGFGDLSFWQVPRRKPEVREKAAEVVAAVREELPGPIPRPVKVAQARLNRLLAEAPPILAGQQAVKIRAQLDALATAAETARRARAARRKAQQIRLLLED